MTSNDLRKIVESYKTNLDNKGNPIKIDILALQGFKFTMKEDKFQELCNLMRSENLIKGTRGGSSDSQECKEVRARWNQFVQTLVKDGLATRDEEYYTLTKKERFVVLDKNNDRIQPSLNMSNVDSKIRKAKEKQKQEMLKK